jgi:hypothetical protein
MQHRYGRYGPRAWKRLQERKYVHRAPVVPVPVAPTPQKIIHLVVPAQTERIIIIVMADGSTNTRDQDFTERGLTVPPGMQVEQDTGEIPRVTAPLSPLQRLAERAAYRASREIKEIIEQGRYVLFEPKVYERLIEAYAEQDISDNDVRTSPQGYPALLQEYQDAYKKSFERLTAAYKEKGRIIDIRDDRERRFREQVLSDRRLVLSRGKGDWHGRDLVVIRWIQFYHASDVEDIDDTILLNHHEFLDRYTDFIFDTEGRNEVSWPTQDSFLKG